MALFTVVLDACALYSSITRDVLLTAATAKVYSPKWSPQILEEMRKAITTKKSAVDQKKLDRLIEQMNVSFPDALVSGFEKLIPGIELKDKNDRHVVAAAVRGGAQQIITWNTKDFPREVLLPLDLEARTPDEFLCDVIDTREELVCARLNERLKSYKKPAMTPDEFFESLENAKLVQTADMLRDLPDFFG